MVTTNNEPAAIHFDRRAMRQPASRPATVWPRPSFTLTELLVVMAILAVMTSMVLAAMAGAINDARKQRTVTIITKIDRLIMERVNEYRYRSVRLQLPPPLTPAQATIQQVSQNRWRLYALRDLMRMELPDRYSDFLLPTALTPVGPAELGVNEGIAGVRVGSVPAVSLGYLRQIQKFQPTATFRDQFESAECLYLILSQMRDGDRTALSAFSPDEIGDFDTDRMPEILDGWGRPISFLRWAPGYVANPPNWNDWTPAANPQSTTVNSGYPSVTSQTIWQFYTDSTGGEVYPENNQLDSLDLLKVDPRWPARYTASNGTLTDEPRYNTMPNNWQVNGRPVAWRPFALRPLIFSNGPDKAGDIRLTYDSGNPADPKFLYGLTGDPSVAGVVARTLNGVGDVAVPVDPYVIIRSGNNIEPWIGACYDTNGNGRAEYLDNITNHAIELGGENNR